MAVACAWDGGALVLVCLFLCLFLWFIFAMNGVKYMCLGIVQYSAFVVARAGEGMLPNLRNGL